MAEIPFVNIGFIVGTLISAALAFIAIVVSDKLISHNIDAKKSFIMALIALFIVPIVATFVLGFVPAVASIPYMASILLPLVFWIGLGEGLLSSDRKTKLKVSVIAFIVYIVLQVFVAPYIRSAIPF
ncbi:MAG: hypothetical protein HYT73_01625 [Candidatus Aenigmarchaeota archaeon]|nr:hypothetical protein [Candidatus Aenigmarchaeota archaeon]